MDQDPTPKLTPEQLADVLNLVRTADSVELKLSVPDHDRRSVVAALEMDPLQSEIRQVVFFDTPDLRLYAQGVVVRARRVARKGDDSVIKLRPVDAELLPGDLRRNPEFGVEVDAMPGGYVCSGSFKVKLGNEAVRNVLLGERPIRKLFTKRQRAFFRQHAPDDIELDDLAILGPINVLKLKFSPSDFGRRLVAELWLYPDGSQILELSTKCLPAEAFEVAVETKAFLGSRGIDLSAHQQTKTRTALEFFAAEARERSTVTEFRTR